MFNQGFPTVYIGGLGDNSFLQQHFRKGWELENDSLFDNAIEEYKKCLENPKATESNKVALHILIGNCYYKLSWLKEAEKHYFEAKRITEEVSDKREQLKGKSAVLSNIGFIYSAYGKLDEALKFHQETLEIDWETGIEHEIASDLGNIGLLYSDMGRPDEALKFHREALKINMSIGFEQGIASAMGNIGLIYHGLGKPDEALKYLQEALEI
ncbi:MAG: tetratricopeptide repeat protein, partial [Candidatus Aminicenantes bacterium]